MPPGARGGSTLAPHPSVRPCGDRRGGIKLSTPYLFIHGTADQTYAYEDMVADVPAEHLVAVEDGSHSMTRNSPEVVATALREFALSLV